MNVLKDMDFRVFEKAIVVSREVRERLIKQIEIDIKFLIEVFKVMDYSMILFKLDRYEAEDEDLNERL